MDETMTKELLGKERINEFVKKKSTKLILKYKESAKSKNECSIYLTVWCPEGKRKMEFQAYVFTWPAFASFYFAKKQPSLQSNYAVATSRFQTM